MSVDLKTVKQQALAELAKQIQENVDKSQAAFLAEAYRKLEEADSQKQIADALLLLPQYKNTAEELIQAKEELLSAKDGLVKLGKVGLRLFARLSSYFGSVPYTGNSSYVGRIRYGDLSWIRDNIVKNTGNPLKLEISSEKMFDFQEDHVYYNCGSCPNQAIGLYILKNTTDEEKKVPMYTYLTSNGSSGWRGAYIVVEGATIWSTTGNSTYSPSFTGNNAITLAPKQSKVIYIHNSAYYRTNNNNVYYYHLRQRVRFDLPEGVEWDYDAYKQLLT